LSENVKRVLSDFGYDWRIVEKDGLTEKQIQDRLKHDAVDKEQNLNKNLEDGIKKIDKKVQSDYEAKLKKSF